MFFIDGVTVPKDTAKPIQLYKVFEKLHPGQILTRTYLKIEDGNVEVLDWIKRPKQHLSLGKISFWNEGRPDPSAEQQQASSRHLKKHNVAILNNKRRKNAEMVDRVSVRYKMPISQFNHRMLLMRLKGVNEDNAIMEKAKDMENLKQFHTCFGLTCTAAEEMYKMFLQDEYVPPFKKDDLTFVMGCEYCFVDYNDLDDLIVHMATHYDKKEKKVCFFCTSVQLVRSNCATHWKTCEWTSMLREFVKKFTFFYHCQKSYVNATVIVKLHCEWMMNKNSYVYKAIHSEPYVFPKNEILEKLKKVYPGAFSAEENI